MSRRPSRQPGYADWTARGRISRGFRRTIKVCATGLMRVLFRMRLEGRTHLPVSGPAMIVCNHQSYLDIPAVFWKYHRWIYFVAKKSLFDKPVLSWVLKLWDAIPIDRNTPGITSVRAIMAHLRQDDFVAIFPQGTRVKRPEERALHPPRDGIIHFATKLNVPIIPMAIRGDFKIGQRVTVVCGEPFYLRTAAAADPGEGDDPAGQGQAALLMDYIFDLIEHPETARPDAALALSLAELTDRQRANLEKVTGRPAAVLADAAPAPESGNSRTEMERPL